MEKRIVYEDGCDASFVYHLSWLVRNGKCEALKEKNPKCTVSEH